MRPCGAIGDASRAFARRAHPGRAIERRRLWLERDAGSAARRRGGAAPAASAMSPDQGAPRRQSASIEPNPIWPSPTMSRSCQGAADPRPSRPATSTTAAAIGSERQRCTDRDGGPGERAPAAGVEQPDVRQPARAAARGTGWPARPPARPAPRPGRVPAPPRPRAAPRGRANPGSRSSRRGPRSPRERHRPRPARLRPRKPRGRRGRCGRATIPISASR